MDRTSWESALPFSSHVAPVTVKEVPASPTSATANLGPDARLTGCKSLAFPTKPAGRSVTLPLPCAPLDHHMDFSLSFRATYGFRALLCSPPPNMAYSLSHSLIRKFGHSDLVIFLLPTVWESGRSSRTHLAFPCTTNWLSGSLHFTLLSLPVGVSYYGGTMGR